MMKNTLLLLFTVFIISGCSKGSDEEPKEDVKKPSNVVNALEQSSRGLNPKKFMDKAQSAADMVDAHTDKEQEHLYDEDIQ